MILYDPNPKVYKNATFILDKIAGAKAGQSIVIIADRESYSEANVMARATKELGAHAFIADVDIYGGDDGYAHAPIMKPLKQAILNADITFIMTPNMKTDAGTFLGSQQDCDTALVGENKRFILEYGGMERWDLDEKAILNNRRRANSLFRWLQKADEVRVTTARGTDITCKVGSTPDGMYPVNGIIPFYSEVAIVPSLGSVNGVAVCDGASERAYGQRGFPIRPNIPGYREIYMEPIRLEFCNSMLVDYSGPACQVARLDALMQNVDPKPDICDELGLVTTTSVENDEYGWKDDGSHHIRCVHVALGNNRRRTEVIHSTEHIDFDIHDPTIYVDGIKICDNGSFFDEIIFEHALT